MENPAPAAEAATSPSIASLIDAYINEKYNKFADKVCRSPDTIKQHLKAVRALWGAMTLAEFAKGSKARVKDQVEQWRRDGLAPNTCRARIAKFKTALKFAFDEELVPDDAKMPSFKLPAGGPPRSRVVDPERELPRLLQELESAAPHTRLATLLLIVTGQRRSAVADLRWEHVDFERRTINFLDTQAPGERTSKRRTNMPMDDFLYALLSEAKRRATCDYVIEWRGRQVKDVYYSVKRVLKRAGLGNVVPHDFRRSSATYVHNELAGDMERAANHIGDTVEMARKVYVQQDVKVRLAGVEAVSGVIAAASKTAVDGVMQR